MLVATAGEADPAAQADEGAGEDTAPAGEADETRDTEANDGP